MSSSVGRRLLAIPIALAMVGVAGLGIGAGGAWASHQFGDVPSSSFFHESISNIVDAGCATGYPDSTFRPNVNPTRGQFAYWTSNCGARVASRASALGLAAGGTNSMPVIDIHAGAAGDGGGFVVVMNSWTAAPPTVAPTSSSAIPEIQFAGGPVGCPCTVTTGVEVTSNSSPATAIAAESSDSWANEFSGRAMSGSGMKVFPVESGEVLTLEGFATYNTADVGADVIEVDITVTAFYIPFGHDGGQSLLPPN